MIKSRLQIGLFALVTDIALSVWSYFQLTNYDEYLKIAKPIVNSPDLQVQLYKIMLQSFTFTILLLLAFHLIIYVLFVRKNTFAGKYVRFYTLMAAISSVIMVVTGVYVGIISMIVYFLCYRSTKQILLLDSPTPKA